MSRMENPEQVSQLAGVRAGAKLYDEIHSERSRALRYALSSFRDTRQGFSFEHGHVRTKSRRAGGLYHRCDKPFRGEAERHFRISHSLHQPKNGPASREVVSRVQPQTLTQLGIIGGSRRSIGQCPWPFPTST